MNRYFHIFSCCIPVKGYSRSIICDLQRGDFELIPNCLFEILTEHKNKSIQEIYDIYGKDYIQVIDEYFEFLIEREYGFFCNSLPGDSFPEMDMDWKNPKLITNCLVDFDSESCHSLKPIADQLSQLYCDAIEIRYFYSKSLDQLKEELIVLEDSTIRSIDLIVGYHISLEQESLKEFLILNKRVRKLLIHSTPKINKEVNVDRHTVVFFTSEKITSENCCGNMLPIYFSCNANLFLESLKFNSCLNKKISIDKKGDIKNCPSKIETFGNIKDTALIEVLAQSNFKKVWRIRKDQIEVCKDCEFRHICTDCRAYLNNPDNVYSKPLKCSYDPYTATWL